MERTILSLDSFSQVQSGVGQQSLLSQAQLADLVHWLQAGKTVDIVRFASKIHRLALAFRTASATS